VFLAADDEEMSPQTCRSVLADTPAGTGRGKVELVWYEGATHNFDDPGRDRQSVSGNRRASDDAMKRAATLIDQAFAR
jgi:dienelactone hydrolase